MRALSTRLVSAAHYIVRCQNRMPAFGKVYLKQDGLPDLALSLKNVSRSGFMAVTSAHIAAGSRVRLVIPWIGAVSADVRWSHDNRMGCRLTRDFTFGQMLRLCLFCAPRSLPAELEIVAVTVIALALIALA
ncbi:MAG TPA: hypothetical protein VMS43_13845 [Allosphingosinicella sp.]|nr:hypothetical protein [Allosphingosinicella sp.]